MACWKWRREVARAFKVVAGRVIIASVLVWAMALPAAGGPSGAQVVQGQVQIDQAGGLTQITASNNSIIHFQKFNIAADEAVRFIQPGVDARVLNRVLGGDPSQIDGMLSANGRVYLLNEAGVFFGKSAIVDAAAIYAGAASMTDADFVAGIDRFTAVKGPVVNQGYISAAEVHLFGRSVVQAGTIEAAAGYVTLSVGDEVMISRTGDRLHVRVTAPADAATQDATAPDAAKVLNDLAAGVGAGDLYGLALHANSDIQGAQVRVTSSGSATLAGTIDASGPGVGGRVDVVADSVTTQAARIDASGDLGGGVVHLGERGTTRDVAVDAATVIHADARTAGDGGEVIVWGDATARFAGRITARAEGPVGDGGFAEVSSERVYVSGHADLSSVGGEAGVFLVDPPEIEIRRDDDVTLGDGADPNIVSDTWVNNQLDTNTTLLLQTTDPADPADPERITVGTGIVLTVQNGQTLQLQAPEIVLNGTIGVDAGGSLNSAGEADTVVLNVGGSLDNALDLLVVAPGSLLQVGAGVNVADALVIDNGDLTVDVLGDATFAGGLTYSAGTLGVAAGQTLSLGGSSSVTAEINVDGGLVFGDLTLDSPGLAAASLSVGGALNLAAGNITTTGNQSYTGTVSVDGAATFDGTDVSFDGELLVNAATTVNAAGNAAFNGNVALADSLAVTATTQTAPTQVDLRNGSLADAVALVDPAGTVRVLGANYAETLTISGASPTIAILGDVGIDDISFDALSFSGGALTVAAGKTLVIDGGATLGASLNLAGALEVLGQTTLSADGLTLAGESLTFGGLLTDGADTFGVTLSATGVIDLVGGVHVGAMTTQNATATRLAGAIEGTSNSLTFATPVVLTADTVVTDAGDVDFQDTIATDTLGPWTLTVNTPQQTIFGGAVGAVAGTELGALTTNAGGTTTINASITTTGDQTFGDGVSVAAAATLTGDGLVFNGALTIDAPTTLDAATATSLNGTVTLNAGLATVGTVNGSTLVRVGAGGTFADGRSIVALPGTIQVLGNTYAELLTLDAAGLTVQLAAGVSQFSGLDYTAGTLTLGAADTLQLTGASTLGGNLTTSGSLDFAPLTVDDGATLTAAGVAFNGLVTLDDLFALGVGTTLNTAAATVDVGAAGRHADARAIVALPGTIRVLGNSYAEALTLDNAGLTVQLAAGTTSFAGLDYTAGTLTLGAADTLQLTAASVLNADPNVAGSLVFDAPLTIDAPTLTAANLTFNDPVTLNQAFTPGGGTTLLVGAPTVRVGAGSTLASGRGIVRLPGTIQLLGNAYGEQLLLDAVGLTIELAAGLTTFDGLTYSAGTLTLGAADTLQLLGPALSTLSNDLTVAGGLIFDGPLSVTSDTVLTARDVAFNNTVQLSAAFSLGGGTTLLNGPTTINLDSGSSYAGARSLLLLPGIININGGAFAELLLIDEADLTVNVLGNATFAGMDYSAGAFTVSAGQTLTLNAASTLSTDVNVAGHLVFAALTLQTDPTLNLTANTIAFDGTVTLDTDVAITGTTTRPTQVDLDGGHFADALALVDPAGLIRVIGPAYAEALTVAPGSPTIRIDAPTVAFDTLTFTGGPLEVTAGNTLSILGAADILAALSVDGSLQVNGLTTLNVAGGGTSVQTGGDQTYGAVALGDDTTLQGANLTLGAVNAPLHDLTLNSGGDTTLNGPVTAAALTTDASGSTIAAADVTTTGNQTYNDRLLLADHVTLTGNNVALLGGVDSDGGGLRDLTINTTGGGLTRFGDGDNADRSGTSGQLRSVTTNADGTTLFNVTLVGSQAALTTVADQTYNDRVLLARDTKLGGANAGATTSIRFLAGVDSDGAAFSNLVVDTDGNGVTQFGDGDNADRSGTTGRLQSVRTNADGTTLVNVALNPGEASIITVADQQYDDAVLLETDAVFAGADALIGTDVLFNAGIDSSGVPRDLTINTDGNGKAYFGDGVGDDRSGDLLALRSVTTSGGAVIEAPVAAGQSSILTVGDQVYNGRVELAADAVLGGTDAGTTTSIRLLDGVTGGSFGLAVNTDGGGETQFGDGGAGDGSTGLGGLTTNADGLTLVNAPTGPAIATIHDMTFGDRVILLADATFTGTGLPVTDIRFLGGIDGQGGAWDLAVNTVGGGQTQFGDGDNADRSGSAGGLASVTTNADGSTLIDIALAGGQASITTTGDQTYGDRVLLGSHTVLAGQDLLLLGGIDSDGGGARDFTANTTGGGVTRFGDGVGNDRSGTSGQLRSVTTNADGQTLFDVALVGAQSTIATTAAQTYGDDVVLISDTTLAGSSITFNGNVTGNRDLIVNAAGTTRFVDAVTVRSLTTDAAGGTTLAGGAVTTTGDLLLGDAVTLAVNNVLAGANITLGGTVAGVGRTLTLNSAGQTRLGDDVLGIAALRTNAGGTTRLDGQTVRTTADITIGDSLVLAGAATLDAGGPIAAAGTITGNFNLTLDAAGGASLGGAVTVGSLSTVATPLTTLSGGSVTTTGNQAYANLVLGVDTVLQGQNVTLGGVSGLRTLTVNGSGITRFGGPVNIVALTTDAPGSTVVAGGSVTTTGNQRFDDSVQLQGGATVVGANVRFADDVTGDALTVTLTGNGQATFDDQVTTGSLTTGPNGQTVFATGGVTTTGSQSYGNAIVATGDLELHARSGEIRFDRGVNALAGQDLTLIAQEVEINPGATLTGAGGTLTFRTATTGRLIVLGNGSGALVLDQAELDRIDGNWDSVLFDLGPGNRQMGIASGGAALGHDVQILGDARDTLVLRGTFTVRGGDLLAQPTSRVEGDVTVRVPSGTLTFQNHVNATTSGADSLTLDARRVELVGAGFRAGLGAARPLREVIVDASTARLGDVFTTGSQRYDAATQLGSTYLSHGGSITFAGPVNLTADTTVRTGGAAGQDITFLRSIDGGHGLTLDANDAAIGSTAGHAKIIFRDDIGQATPLRELSINDLGATRSTTVPTDETVLGVVRTGDDALNIAAGSVRFGQNEKLATRKADGSIGGGQAGLRIVTGGGDITIGDVSTDGAMLLDAGAGTIRLLSRPAGQITGLGGSFPDEGLDYVAVGTGSGITFVSDQPIQIAGAYATPGFALDPSAGVDDTALRVSFENSRGGVQFMQRGGVIENRRVGTVFDPKHLGDHGAVNVVADPSSLVMGFVVEQPDVAFSPSDPTFSAAQLEMLRRMGVYPRLLSQDESRMLQESGWTLVNDIPSPSVDAEDQRLLYETAQRRIADRVLDRALALYEQLYYAPAADGEESGPREYSPQRLRTILDQAVTAYIEQYDEPDVDVFRAFVNDSPELAEARQILDDLGELLDVLYLAGLNDVELLQASQMLLLESQVVPEAFGDDWQLLLRVIRSEGHAAAERTPEAPPAAGDPVASRIW